MNLQVFAVEKNKLRLLCKTICNFLHLDGTDLP
jgi:hypothetical protein